jgi:hypothetical protein
VSYASRMQADILALLGLFRDRVPDSESLALVVALAADRDAWDNAHDLFSLVRARNLQAIKSGDLVRECQYCFEEICLKSLYNKTDTTAPFDSSSPYCVIKNALFLAQALGMPVQEVVAIVAPTA